MDPQQAIENPFEQAPQPAAGSTDQAIDNPFDGGSPAPVGEMRAAPQGDFRRWLGDLENDVMDGGGRTVVGRVLQKIGAPGLGKGVSPEQANAMGSVPLGIIHTAQGASNMMQHPVRGAVQAAKGMMQTATIPASFVAPEAPVEEAADAVPAVAGKVADALSPVLDSAKSFAQKWYVPSAVKDVAAAGQDPAVIQQATRSAEDINRTALPELQSRVGKVIDDANAAIGHDTTGETSLSQKLASGGQAYKEKGQALYKRADEIAEQATGQKGMFQRLGQAVQDTQAALADPALTPIEKEELTARLASAQDAFDKYKQLAASQGVDVEKLTAQANKLYSTGLSLEEFGRGVFRQEDRAGNLIPRVRPLDAPVKQVSADISKRGHVLQNAVGEQGVGEISDAVDRAAQNIQALRNQKATAQQTVRAGKEAQQRIAQTRGRQWKAGLAVAGAVGAGKVGSALYGAARK